ncbi:metacaspase-1-like [Salvia hispanica]|uniref:metacaspase-1-like n=1 Tax=Salvia hispanica TaxID=49212 RepID=UPI00200962BE|nr:metacaspase-1-like [Salvia hispanica]
MAESKGLCFTRRQKNSGDRGNTLSPAPITLRQAARGKRALLCCISYKKKKFELKGTIHDMKNMRDLLIHQFHFPPESILILAEKETYLEPTRKNIEDSFRWLMRGIEEGDSLVFYFSGHGLRQRGIHGDEIDGFDETICPLDFETNGMIFDNYINETLVNPLIKGVTLHAIVDSCHSGTVLDLPLVYNINTNKWDDNSPEEGRNAFKGTSGGKAICFSACEDYQQAADTTAFSTDKNSTGAMTYTFIKAVKAAVTSKRKISYREILLQMHESLKKEDHSGGCARARLRRVFTRKILQDPLLSSSEEFDANTEFKL